MTQEIFHNIPVPTSVERPGVNIELLKSMDVGDSTWWPPGEYKKATRFYRVASKLGVSIVIRKVNDSHPRGAGVCMWRVDKTAQPDAIARSEAKALAAKAPAPKVPTKKKAAPKTAPKAAKKAVEMQPAKPKRDRSKDKPRKRKAVAGVPSTPAFKKAQATA